MMAKTHFSIIDVTVAFISLLTYVFDVGTDILLCVQLHVNGYEAWGWLMLTFIAVPAIVASVFSLTWHVQDKSLTSSTIVLHLFLLAPIQRYIYVIYMGIKSRRTKKVVDTQTGLRAQNDVSILRLFESFLEAAPQLVLQMYMMVHFRKQVDWFTGFSAASSLVSLTWAMTAYSDSLRRAHSPNYQRRILRLLLHWGWQLFMTTARIAAFVFFASALHYWVLVGMGGHWMFAFVWISVRGTDFGNSCCERWMFRVVCGFIYIFVFLNLNDGLSRWRITCYYILIFVENLAMLALFIVMGGRQHLILVACLVILMGFFLGILCMLTYYGFLHPSGPKSSLKKLFWPKARTLNTSARTGPQIFSVESPQPVQVMDGTSVDLSHNTNSSMSSGTSIPQTKLSTQSPGGIKFLSKKDSKAIPSQLALQEAMWQSGMESSSGSSSSSSLTSIGDAVANARRTPSVKSLNSDNSATSENCLLPVVGRNDLSKLPPKKQSPAGNKASMDAKKEVLDYASESDNMNVTSNGSGSPALSRGSWGRASDNNRQSLVLEDFTTLGFDDSSSIDRKNSDCSSFSSRPKSLSPLSASHSYQDVNGRLKATIAATIAAAMGNPSSNEGTPNRNRSSLSHNTTASSQSSLNSGYINNSSSTHNIGFMDSVSSYQEKEGGSSLLNASQDSARQREAMTSLPNILEAMDQERPSDAGMVDSSYEKSAGESMIRLDSNVEIMEMDENTMQDIPRYGGLNISQHSMQGGLSPAVNDSTLTASKLTTKKKSPVSYHTSQMIEYNEEYADSEKSSKPVDLSKWQERVPSESRSLKSGSTRHKGDSPFSDQELTSVMARSLQSYSGATSSNNSCEREGLALTLEDLQLSAKNMSQSGLPKNELSWRNSDCLVSHKTTEGWKSRSASSLFHDSDDSSPVSSASKMNRLSGAQKAETNLSPNALKQLGPSPPVPINLGSDTTELSESGVASHSHALKYIMEAYGPNFGTPVSQKSFHWTGSSSITPSCFGDKSVPIIHKFLEDSFHSNLLSPCLETPIKNSALKPHISKVIKSPEAPLKQRCEKDVSLSRPGNRSESDEKPLQTRLHNSPKKNYKEDVHIPETRASISSTKKLHLGSFPLLEYKSSPIKLGPSCDTEASDTESDMVGYVAGKYCPPLCQDIRSTDFYDDPLLHNLNRGQRTSLDLGSKRKSIMELSNDDNTDRIRRFSMGEGSVSDIHSIRKEIIRQNLKRKQKQNTNFRPPDHSGQIFTDRFLNSNLSSPSLRPSSPSFVTDSVNRSSFSHLPASGGWGDMDRLSEQELKLSAKHIADYYSQALETQSSNPCYRSRPKKYYSQPQLQAQVQRQPLQRLENSAALSPEDRGNTVSGRSYMQALNGVDGQNDSAPRRMERNSMRSSKKSVSFSNSMRPSIETTFPSGVGSRKVTQRPPAHKSFSQSNLSVHTYNKPASHRRHYEDLEPSLSRRK